MKKTTWLKIGVSVLVTAILCLIAWSGILTGMDGSVSDLLYQRPGMTDGEIVVIGAEPKSLEAGLSLSAEMEPRVAEAAAMAVEELSVENRL